MRLRFFFGILIAVCINTNVYAICNDTNIGYGERNCPDITISLNKNDTTNNSNNSKSLPDSLSYTTALINSLNNSIAIENNLLTILSIVVAFLGITGFLGVNRMVRKVNARFQNQDDKISAGLNIIKEEKNKIREDFNNNINQCKADINEFKTYINNLIDGKIDEIDGLKQDIVKEKKMIESILKNQKYQNRYIQRINQYIFNASSIVDYDLTNKVAVQEIRERTHRYFRLIIVYLPW